MSVPGLPPAFWSCTSALHIHDAGHGLDQLQVEGAAGAAQDAALGQDAEALIVGPLIKTKQLAVELGSVVQSPMRLVPTYCTLPNQCNPPSAGGHLPTVGMGTKSICQIEKSWLRSKKYKQLTRTPWMAGLLSSITSTRVGRPQTPRSSARW